MKNLIVLALLGSLSAPAFAAYECVSTDKKVSAWLLFDSSYGGLTHATFTIDGQEFSDFGSEGSKNYISDRESLLGGYEYYGERVEIGFDGARSIDLIVDEVLPNVYYGDLYLDSDKPTKKMICTYN